jgi:hypothetical protein
MQIIELANSSLHLDKWQKTLEYIEKSHDQLKHNYLNLDFESFLSFQAVVEDDEIICFSGLQSNNEKWGPLILRCSSRMWVHPDYRQPGLKKFTQGNKFLNSYYLIPNQLKLAKDLGYRCVFMSREKNPRAFKEWTDLVNRNAESNFVVLPNRYNVCGQQHNITESCKQSISLNYSDIDSVDIWNTYMAKHLIDNC